MDTYSVKDYVRMSDNAFQCKDLIDMEMKILKVLDFHLTIPIVTDFIRRYKKAAKLDKKMYSACKYFLELASLDCELAIKKASEVGLNYR
jgi:hypothetical protein